MPVVAAARGFEIAQGMEEARRQLDGEQHAAEQQAADEEDQDADDGGDAIKMARAEMAAENIRGAADADLGQAFHAAWIDFLRGRRKQHCRQLRVRIIELPTDHILIGFQFIRTNHALISAILAHDFW